MSQAKFVAINTIQVKPEYVSRFEDLFASRAHAIDRMPGFISMKVLRPSSDGEPYLVISNWETEDAFKSWTGSEEFLEGHRRAFADLAEYKARGEEPPMKSDFRVYSVLTD